MENTNLLAGVACPRCGQALERLIVAGTVWLDVTDDGSVPTDAPGRGDHEWDADAITECPRCNYMDRFGAFAASERERESIAHWLHVYAEVLAPAHLRNPSPRVRRSVCRVLVARNRTAPRPPAPLDRLATVAREVCAYERPLEDLADVLADLGLDPSPYGEAEEGAAS